MSEHPVYQTPLLVETPRLLLYPLDYTLLKKFASSSFALETALQLTHHPRHVTELLEEIIEEELLALVKSNVAHYHYYTLWIIIRKEDWTIVGNINCKGKPTVLGEVEIGYETADEFQNQGYMTEAVKGFSHWLLTTQKAVRTIFSVTNDSNEPSMAVMRKNNFSSSIKANNTIRWEKRL